MLSAMRRHAVTAVLTLAALFSCIPAWADDAASNVTLDATNVPLESVLQKIEAQTGYRFFYNRDVIDVSSPTTVHGKN